MYIYMVETAELEGRTRQLTRIIFKSRIATCHSDLIMIKISQNYQISQDLKATRLSLLYMYVSLRGLQFGGGGAPIPFYPASLYYLEYRQPRVPPEITDMVLHHR